MTLLQSQEDEEGPDSCRTFLEYHGSASTMDCAEAVERLIHGGRDIASALILTVSREGNETAGHALFLVDTVGDEVIIKDGFSSGYGGTGPKGFSATLRLLDWHGISLAEIEVDDALMERLRASALTLGDLERIRTTQPVRPHRYWQYVHDLDDRPSFEGNPWATRERLIPFALLDARLAPAARDFWTDPDTVLMKSHRELEQAVRLKAGMTKEEATDGPAAVYRFAFGGNAPRLRWPDVTKSEHAGRVNLFMGVLTAYRHVRAHRSERSDPDELLSELLLLNHLFRLESAAEPVEVADA